MRYVYKQFDILVHSDQIFSGFVVDAKKICQITAAMIHCIKSEKNPHKNKIILINIKMLYDRNLLDSKIRLYYFFVKHKSILIKQNSNKMLFDIFDAKFHKFGLK